MNPHLFYSVQLAKETQLMGARLTHACTHKQSAGDPEARLRLFMPLRSVSNKDDELLVWGRFVDII